MMRRAIKPPKSWSGGIQPLAGSQPSRTAKKATMMMPTRKLGIAMPIWVSAETNVLPVRASHMPIGTAPARAKRIASPTKISETCARSATSGVMSCWEAREVPKSPLSRPPTHSKYCVKSGRSRPSATRAGLPGTARMSRKMAMEAANKVTTNLARALR